MIGSVFDFAFLTESINYWNIVGCGLIKLLIIIH